MQENQYSKVPDNIGTFAFENFDSFDSYYNAAYPELKRITGLDKMEKLAKVPLNPTTLWRRENELGIIEKIRIFVEENESACMYFGVPKQRNYSPTFICLHGHSTGMHTSIAVDWRDEITPIQNDGDRDFCLECMRRGIIGVAFEQRYMGERSSNAEHKPSCGCLNGGAGATQALLLGRTAIGERVYDVDRLIDYLLTRPEIDSSELGIMGGSGGGTTAMFAGAMLSRLKYIMPAVSFSSFRASIGSMYHCECNYIPGLLNFGESADVAGLCAPQKLVIVNGRFDSIFPLDAGLRQFERVKNIYRAAGTVDNCRMVIGEGGHRFYADIAWETMLKFFLK